MIIFYIKLNFQDAALFHNLSTTQIISKGMTKDEVKMNGEIAKKLVKESEDKKANGEEIVDKQVICI